MEIKITKRDVAWNYISQIFSLGSGLIVLPVVLRLLSPEEIGMNYLMLSVSSLVSLADFGFSSQFGRNLTYVFSGAQELKKEGMGDCASGNVNYHLLAVVIETAKYIYRKLSLFVLALMLSFGTWYMYKATNGFTTIPNSLIIWILFSISTYFSMYFMYYGSLLTGAAMIKESYQASILNRISYIVISFVLLFSGVGLMSVVIAGLISPFIGRWFSFRKFYNKEIMEFLKDQIITKEEVLETFDLLWYNAKKLGLNFIGAYGIQQSSLFVMGLFLSLSEVASYGLMYQLFQVLVGLSIGVFNTIQPSFYKNRVEGNFDRIKRDFSFSVVIFIIIFMGGGSIIVLGGAPILVLIKSAASLPTLVVLLVYFVHLFLEIFHSLCASMIVVNNEVPFVKPAIYSGLLIVLCNILTLELTNLGLLGIVGGQLLIQSMYNHWRWPQWVLKDLQCSLFDLIRLGVSELDNHLKVYVKGSKPKLSF